MKSTSFKYFSIAFFLSLFMAISCKGPETTVVRQSPVTESADTTATEDTTAGEPSAAFRQINIGEINPILTLDPLFADNAGTMRAVQLVYEGLVRYNKDGSVIPGIAKNWTVAKDSLRYQFTLRNDVFYHDSNVFNSGIGRKLKSDDVKFVFERMAKNSVPKDAAQLFMPVMGFEPYYQEQHNLLNPSKRVLNSIRGIQTPNDSTVVFNLVEKDPHFMQKLASPYAVIYPREAVTDNNPNQFKAVGTGPFTLSQQRGDSVYTFSKFKNYYDPQVPVANRVDIIVKKKEAELFKAFVNGDIHVLPELGLQTLQGALNQKEELRANYTSTYTLEEPKGASRYLLNYNPNSDMPKEMAHALAGMFDSTDTFEDLSGEMISFRSYPVLTQDSSYNISPRDTVNITGAEDSYSFHLMVKLRDKLQQRDATLQVFEIFTPTRNTGLYTSHLLPFSDRKLAEKEEHTLVSFTVPHRVLYHGDIKNIHFNRFPWWIEMRTADFTSIQ